MRNKWFAPVLLIVVMLCICWTSALADEERETFTSEDYEYALLDDGTVEITRYYGNAEKLTIPDTLGGKKVTSIGNRTFLWCDSLTSVIIPDSVTSIGDGAFFACDSLTSITIPDSVAQISENPFTSCSSLKIISVSPEHLYFAAIDGVLFRKADKALISYPAGIESPTYTIPQGITSIGDGAFSFCDSLTSITIPNSVTSIGDGAFSSCSSLTSVSIPDSIEQIGVNPFTSCSRLKKIYVSPEHLYFATIDGVLFRKADKALISYPAGISSSTYTIPQGITSIGDSAFSGCSSLTSISIPDSVTSISDGTFYYCTSLTSVTIPNSVTSIGDSAFADCKFLTSVSIPDSVTSIGDGAFYACYSLTSITIPDSVTSIGDWAFASCKFLTSVTIPDSVTSIGDGAFLLCPANLTVPRNSYALEYAKANKIPYTYPDANDWLNN